MAISVLDLDRGYDQCADLHNHVCTNGGNLINEMADTINSLKVNWVSGDATTHINNLIKVYNALVEVVGAGKVTVANAAADIVAIQEVRRQNGGAGNVGEQLDVNEPSFQTLANVSETNGYDADAAALNNDYQALSAEYDEFGTFTKTFISLKEELLANWTDGSNHADAVTKFNNFEDNSAEYNSVFKNAVDNLGAASGGVTTIDTGDHSSGGTF